LTEPKTVISTFHQWTLRSDRQTHIQANKVLKIPTEHYYSIRFNVL